MLSLRLQWMSFWTVLHSLANSTWIPWFINWMTNEAVCHGSGCETHSHLDPSAKCLSETVCPPLYHIRPYCMVSFIFHVLELSAASHCPAPPF